MKVHPICGGPARILARCFPQATPPSSIKYCAILAPRHVHSALKPVSDRRLFSSSRMTAQKIDGTAIAKAIRERLGQKIQERQAGNPRYRPSLKIVQGEAQHCH